MRLSDYAALHPLVRTLIDQSTLEDRNALFPARQPIPNATVRCYPRLKVREGHKPRTLSVGSSGGGAPIDLWLEFPSGKTAARIDPRTAEGRAALDRLTLVEG